MSPRTRIPAPLSIPSLTAQDTRRRPVKKLDSFIIEMRSTLDRILDAEGIAKLRASVWHKPVSKPTLVQSMDPYLTTNEAAAFLGLGRSTFLRDVKAGQLPKPIYITQRSPRWRASELREAVESRGLWR